MTRIARVLALSVVTTLCLTGCGAAGTVLGIHEAPKADAASAPLTVARADSILARVFATAYQADTRTGAASRVAQRTAYTGEGLRAARARVKLSGLRPKVADSPRPKRPQPRLLALSRGGGFPRVIVAQTVTSAGSLPILHLLTSPDAATPYRIRASVTMMPLATVKLFDALGQGSPLVTDGTGLAVAPAALLKAYASGLAFPAKATAKQPFAADPFSTQVRAKAAGVAKDVAAQARFSQVHKVVPNSVYAVRQASGDALVFGVVERTDDLEVKSGQTVNTGDNKNFVLLTGKKSVTKAALITTLEFVVFTVPRSKGKATLVAASEQFVAGSGS